MNTTQETKTLMTTPMGSRLHGFASPTSDYDRFTLTMTLNKKTGQQPRRAKHQMQGEDDHLMMELSTFMHLCEEGTPQSLEAMFSTQAEASAEFEPMRRLYRAGLTATTSRFRKTMFNGMTEARKKGTSKPRRHTLRLMDYMNQMFMNNGRFNPTLAPANAALYLELCESESETLAYMKKSSYLELDWDRLEFLLSEEG